MSIWNAIVQAIVQGLTEFLPVSSSGHLALVQHFTNTSPEMNTFLSVVLHLGTLVAVFVAFRQTIGQLILEFFRLLKDIFTGKFRFKEMNEYRRMIVMLVVAIIPLCCLLPVYGKLNELVGNPNLFVLGVCFLVTSVLLYLADRCVKGIRTGKDMRVRDALAVGLTQCVATLPGVSRSGSTVAIGMLCGLSKKYALEFSFILGIPAILGAGLMEAKDILAAPVSSGLSGETLLPAIIGFLVAAVVGFLAIKMVEWLVASDKYRIFAYYTLAIGIVTLGVGIFELVVR